MTFDLKIGLLLNQDAKRVKGQWVGNWLQMVTIFHYFSIPTKHAYPPGPWMKQIDPFNLFPEVFSFFRPFAPSPLLDNLHSLEKKKKKKFNLHLASQ